MSSTIDSLRARLALLVEQDGSGLDTALRELAEQVEGPLQQDLAEEWVHPADDIYKYLGREGTERRIALLARYRSSTSDPGERYWAHWNLADSYAVLRRNPEAIEEQKKLLNWAYQELPDHQLMLSLSDATQAKCWVSEGELENWLEWYTSILDRIEAKQEDDRNRLCHLLRTGSIVFAEAKRYDEALAQLHRLEEVADTSSRSLYWWDSAMNRRLAIHQKREDWEAFQRTAEEAIGFVDGQLAVRDAGREIDVRMMRLITHNFGATLMRAGRFETAERLLSESLQLGGSGMTHFCLAATVWGSRKDRQEALKHLGAAQSSTKHNALMRGRYWQFFLEQPLFEDVWQDQEFLGVLQRQN